MEGQKDANIKISFFFSLFSIGHKIEERETQKIWFV